MKEATYKEDNNYLPYYLEQEELAKQVITTNQLQNPIQHVAGVDVAYDEDNNKMVGAVVVLNTNTLEVVEQAHHIMDITFPYVPGLFSFRETPSIIEAFKKVKTKVDLIICDGHGIAHPKGIGMATHLGIQLDIPTIGCAKKKLVGMYDKSTLGSSRGDQQELIWNHKIVGVALRTQDDIKPMFVSIGHKIDLETAVDIVLKFCPTYRLPETTRQADQLVNSLL